MFQRTFLASLIASTLAGAGLSPTPATAAEGAVVLEKDNVITMDPDQRKKVKPLELLPEPLHLRLAAMEELRIRISERCEARIRRLVLGSFDPQPHLLKRPR